LICRSYFSLWVPCASGFCCRFHHGRSTVSGPAQFAACTRYRPPRTIRSACRRFTLFPPSSPTLFYQSRLPASSPLRRQARHRSSDSAARRVLMLIILIVRPARKKGGTVFPIDMTRYHRHICVSSFTALLQVSRLQDVPVRYSPDHRPPLTFHAWRYQRELFSVAYSIPALLHRFQRHAFALIALARVHRLSPVFPSQSSSYRCHYAWFRLDVSRFYRQRRLSSLCLRAYDFIASMPTRRTRARRSGRKHRCHVTWRKHGLCRQTYAVLRRVI